MNRRARLFGGDRRHDRGIAIMVLGLTVLAAALWVAGCGGDTQAHHFSNEGRLCLFPGTETDPSTLGQSPRSFVADQPVKLAVQFPVCLSSSCSKDPVTSCTVTASGTSLQITSSGSFNEVTTGACTTDCRTLVASCSTANLPTGTYTFTHGGQQVSLTIPSTVAPPCVGAGAGIGP
jgi:hypothetical protein